MIIEPKVYASESQHWYCKHTGKPVYEVPNASKPGELRPTTLRDARRLELVPSVSAIIRQVHRPGLEKWKIGNAIRCAVNRPYVGGEDLEGYVRWVQQKAQEEASLASEKGTQIHAAIENRMRVMPTSPEMLPFIEAAQAALDQIGFKSPTAPRVENSFAHPMGYGGKIDLHDDCKVIDFKSKSGSFYDAESFGYDEHAMQLAAYREGLKCPYSRCFNVFISTDQPGRFHVREWNEKELNRAWRMFCCLLNFWQISKSYYP